MPVMSVITAKLLDRAKVLIKEEVIARWSSYRQHRFTNALVDAIRDERDYEVSEDDLDKILSELVKNDQNSEALFDAYRRVSLARSRDIGPRMIGMLTAKLILEQRNPTNNEAAVLDASENLNDDELRDVVTTVNEWKKLARDDGLRAWIVEGQLLFVAKEASVEGKHGQSSDTGSVLIDTLGPWGEKLRTYGLLLEQIQDKVQKKPGQLSMSSMEFGPDRHITHSIVFRDGYQDLVDLIERAARAADTTKA